MSPFPFVFRTKISPTIGMGHFMRLVALAEMFLDLNCIFSIECPEQVKLTQYLPSNAKLLLQDDSAFFESLNSTTGIAVLDGYDFDANYQQRIKKSGWKCVFIDDSKILDSPADLIINPANGVNPNSYTNQSADRQILIGSQYALLRSEILDVAKSKSFHFKPPEHILLSFGSSDTLNLSHSFAQTLLKENSIQKISVLTSSLNPNLPQLEALVMSERKRLELRQNLSTTELIRLVEEADCCICSASTLTTEMIALRKPVICGITADNQQSLYESFIDKAAVLGLGDLTESPILDSSAIAEQVFRLNDPQFAQLLFQKQQLFIDGDSALRLRKKFQYLFPC